jgi:hypothetical protein
MPVAPHAVLKLSAGPHPPLMHSVTSAAECTRPFVSMAVNGPIFHSAFSSAAAQRKRATRQFERHCALPPRVRSPAIGVQACPRVDARPRFFTGRSEAQKDESARIEVRMRRRRTMALRVRGWPTRLMRVPDFLQRDREIGRTRVGGLALPPARPPGRARRERGERVRGMTRSALAALATRRRKPTGSDWKVKVLWRL